MTWLGLVLGRIGYHLPCLEWVLRRLICLPFFVVVGFCGIFVVKYGLEFVLQPISAILRRLARSGINGERMNDTDCSVCLRTIIVH